MNYFSFGKTLARKNAQKRRRNAESAAWRKELASAKNEIKKGEKVV